MKALSNIDTLEAGIEIKNWDGTSEFLEVLKEKREKMQDKEILFTPIKINETVFNLQNYGVRFYPYVLINEDCFNIYIAKKPMNNHCPIRVTLRSMFLWEHGYWKAWEIVKETIESLGFKYVTSKLSRVDLACHVQGLNLTDIFQNTQDFIKIRTKAKQRCRPSYDLENINNIQMTSMVVGSGDNIMLRIYDKVKELEERRNIVKENFFKDIIWKRAGIKPDDGYIYNVEFQMRREAFKTFHYTNGKELSTVENLFFCINDIWTYLTKEWFSLVDPNSDSNRTRQAMIPEWEYISNQKFDLEECGFTDIERMYHKSAKQEAAIRGVAAYATSYAVQCYENKYDYVMNEIKTRLGIMIDNEMYNWDRKIKDKLNKLPSIKEFGEFQDNGLVPEI